MTRSVWLPVLAAILSPPVTARAELFGTEFGKCGEGSTLAIVECLGVRTKTWDRRLNTAYSALMQRVDTQQQDPLKAVQRLWIQYRDANCRFYGSREGSVRQIEAAECMRGMTEDRARELEQALKN